jgi:tetratricopeptide (TPR) repeat protein
MRTRQWFLMLFNILLFFVAVFSSPLAEENLPAIVKRIQPSVVVILTYDKNGKILGQGSGFFINDKGNVITNRHVLEGADRAEVKTANGKVFSVMKVLAEDKEGDLIRVSVEIHKSVVSPISVSATIPEVGEKVVVIGSPLGLEQTVSDGIVSAVREIPTFGKLIQITAPISSGSSGSPVVNVRGEVIGVATFQIVEGQNLNFAIPGERVTRLTPGKGQTLAEWTGGKIEELAPADSLYNKGLTLVWVGDYEKALPYFEEAVKKDTSYAEAYFYIGYCNSELGRYNEAVEAFKQAIRIKPDLAGAHSLLGWTYDALGLYNEAVEAYKQGIRIKPDVAELHYILGVAYGKLERYDEAVEAYKQAIRIKPDDAKAHYNLGTAYGELGRWNEAVEAYKQAIRIKPDYAEAHLNLGVAYGSLGRHNEAVEASKQAIRIKPDFAEAHLNLGVAYGSLARNNEAVEAFKQAIRIKPDLANAHYGLGLIYLRLGDSGSALDEYKILKDLDMDLANQLFNLIYK